MAGLCSSPLITSFPDWLKSALKCPPSCVVFTVKATESWWAAGSQTDTVDCKGCDQGNLNTEGPCQGGVTLLNTAKMLHSHRGGGGGSFLCSNAALSNHERTAIIISCNLCSKHLPIKHLTKEPKSEAIYQFFNEPSQSLNDSFLLFIVLHLELISWQNSMWMLFGSLTLKFWMSDIPASVWMQHCYKRPKKCKSHCENPRSGLSPKWNQLNPLHWGIYTYISQVCL